MKAIQQADYSGRTIHFGLDYHKKSWTVHPLDGQVKGKAYTITKPTPEELHRRLHLSYPNGTFVGVYEAGFGGFSLARNLKQYEITLHPIHAADVPQTDKERQQKSDPSDAYRLAKLARSGDYEAIYVPTPTQEAFRQMVRRRMDLSKEMTRLKNKIKGHLMFRGRVPEELRYDDWSLTKRRIVELEELGREINAEDGLQDYLLLSLLTELENRRQEQLSFTRELRQIAQKQDKELYTCLLSSPGIGPIWAMGLMGEIMTMERFDNFDQLCAYAGLIGRTHNSGEKEVAGRLVSRGNKRLRLILIEAAWCAKRLDPALGLYYSRLVNDEKMQPNKAIVKVARKLLSRIRHIWMTKEEYEKGIM